jgi:S-DNA-T family DNA segregation ATPase FtsK/SpoIIIE
MREEYGNVTGHAVGNGPVAGPGMDILGDVVKAFRAGEDQLWNERIADRLAPLQPDMYGGWDGSMVTTALKPWGVPVGQVWGTTDDGQGANRRGIKKADVTAAIARRDADRKAA